MTIEVLYFEGCPHANAAVDAVREAVVRLGVDAEVTLRRIESPEAAEAERFLGSPTVRVDGRDIDPAAAGAKRFGLTCRRYGESGVPPREMIEAAIRAAAGGAR